MKNRINFCKSKNFRYNLISYGFFSREGGVSQIPYDTLNCSKSSGDNIAKVEENIKRVLKRLNLSKRTLVVGNQVHGNNVIKIEKKYNNKKIRKADGFVTGYKKYALGILTADCAPIFFYDRKSHIIGAAHAGWKGCLNNICNNVILKMLEKGCKIDNIKAIIGPCISQKNYEVDNKIFIKYLKKNKNYKKFFHLKNSKKYNFDLFGTLKYQLNKIGIETLGFYKEDTYKYKNKYYSHRRSAHLNEKKTGRMINIIGFK